ncbi:hypothetical protein VNI00_017714 [Paramarasmius palmivorus]|uniref:Uncharacterized protein n=1 Tax=Paramarasmius palmivorus TaxID=297713 RepID=A0AAW0B6Q5_9AGAR
MLRCIDPQHKPITKPERYKTRSNSIESKADRKAKPPVIRPPTRLLRPRNVDLYTYCSNFAFDLSRNNYQCKQIAMQLNGMSYAQQQAVRLLVETILQYTSPEPIAEILAQTTFMEDLAAGTDDDENEWNANEASEEDLSHTKASAEEDSEEEQLDSESSGKEKESEEESSGAEEANDYIVVDDSSDMDISEQ